MFVSVYLVLSFLLFEWFFVICVICYLCWSSRYHLYLLNATWLDLREFESAPSLEDEKAPMAAKRYAPSHFDQHVRLPAWGFLLVFYSSHSPKICRFEPRAWDRQRHGRTDGWTGWWMCRQTTVYLRDNGYVSTNIHKLVVHLSSTKLSVCDSASAETKREQSMLSYCPFMALRVTFSGAK